MATQSQKLQFREELKELAALFDDETMEATEINETDKFTNANYMLMEGHSIDSVVTQTWGYKEGSKEHTEMKEKFQQWLED